MYENKGTLRDKGEDDRFKLLPCKKSNEFLFVAEYYSIVYLYHIFFSIHLSLDI